MERSRPFQQRAGALHHRLVDHLSFEREGADTVRRGALEFRHHAARAIELGVKFIVSSTVIDCAAAKISSDNAQRIELAAGGRTTVAYTMPSITRTFSPDVT